MKRRARFNFKAASKTGFETPARNFLKMKQEQVLRIKIAGRRALDNVRRAVLGLVRRIPFTAQSLGLPVKEIRSVRQWVNEQRQRLDWIERCKGPHYESLQESLTLIRRLPRSVIAREVPRAFSFESYHVLNELFVARIPEARIVGTSGAVITPDGGLLEESMWGMGWLQKDRALNSFKLKYERRQGNFYTIASLFSEGYAHWVLDTLPRLYALDRSPTDDLQIIVSRPLADWHKESLAMLGLENMRFVALEDRCLQLETLYFPGYVGDPGNHHPQGCRWLRERFLKDYKKERGTRRLYITRRLARGRRVLNEEELQPILNDYGFEIVETENLSFRGKVELLSDAEIVVGPHGGGLTNLLFAPQSCRVLELFDPGHLNAAYYALADALGQEYWYIVGEAANTAGAQHAMSGHDDIRVSPATFAQTLRHLLKH